MRRASGSRKKKPVPRLSILPSTSICMDYIWIVSATTYGLAGEDKRDFARSRRPKTDGSLPVLPRGSFTSQD